MSPLVRKEIRLLLPYWGLAMFLAVAFSFVLARDLYDTSNQYFFWAFGFGMVLLGLAPFGYEFGAGTFSSLMVQPMERRRIWRLKILVTAVAALLVFLAFESLLFWDMSVHLNDWSAHLLTRFSPFDARMNQLQMEQQNLFWVNFWHTSRAILVVLLVALTGGFWATLLFRQTGAAFWFVILAPGTIGVALEPISRLFRPEAQGAIVSVVFCLYSAAGFLWARRMFTCAQDYQWLGDTIAFVNLKSTKAHDDSVGYRRKRVFGALVRKELQSHQISFLIAFGFLVMHICTLVARGIYQLPKHSESRFVLESVPVLWLLVPWLMGCVAIAEERKLGTMQSQLCLSVSRRLQFAIKLAVVFVAGVVLGGLMPSLIEAIGTRAGVYSEFVASPGNGTYLATVLELVAIAGLSALVALFASSLARTTLQALGVATVFGVGWTILFAWVRQDAFHRQYSIWKGPLVFGIGVPVAIIATIALSFLNYKKLHAGGREWLRALVVYAVTLFCAGIAAAFIYQRPWDLVMSSEPEPGARHLTGTVRPVIANADLRSVVLLPDGRLWLGMDYKIMEVDQKVSVMNGAEFVTQKERIWVPSTGAFVEGSNWVELATGMGLMGVIARQADGTLWSILSYHPTTNEHRLTEWLSRKPEPHRLGSDADWKAVGTGLGGFYGIKTDGTLWSLADRYGTIFGAGEDHPYMEQVGKDSDWSRFFGQGQRAMVMKTNGEIWGWQNNQNMPAAVLRFARLGLNGADWLNAGGSFFHDLIVRKDGTLWAQPSRWGPQTFFGSEVPQSEGTGLVRIGRGNDWLEIAGTPDNLFAIKKDGTIRKSGTELFGTSLGRPSKRSDWLVIDADGSEMCALAADGTLAMWVDTHAASDGSQWLAAPRRPVWSLNILLDSKN